MWSSLSSRDQALVLFALPRSADTCAARRRYSVTYVSMLPRAALPVAASRIRGASQKSATAKMPSGGMSAGAFTGGGVLRHRSAWEKRSCLCPTGLTGQTCPTRGRAAPASRRKKTPTRRGVPPEKENPLYILGALGHVTLKICSNSPQKTADFGPRPDLARRSSKSEDGNPGKKKSRPAGAGVAVQIGLFGDFLPLFRKVFQFHLTGSDKNFTHHDKAMVLSFQFGANGF